MPGDKLILTKPLGTQLATNAKLWLTEDSDNWLILSQNMSASDIEDSYKMAVKSMSTLNKIGASLMHKYNAHAATDVTGFGFLGHAQNLCKYQKRKLNFILHTLPIIKNVYRMAYLLNVKEKLLSGRSVETSGGLLICVSTENALGFCLEFNELTGKSCYIVGDVVEGNGTVELISNPAIISVYIDT